MKRELWYSVVVRDRHGKVISRERHRSKSFLKQWNQLVYAHMSQSLTLTITDTGGTPRSVQFDPDNFSMDAIAGVDTYGIRVGTGNTAVDISDYALESPIANGVGAGDLIYWLCAVADPVVAAPSCSFEVSRTMVNDSGNEITAREAGIYMKMEAFFGCAVRDVFATPQAVPNGGAITVNWTLQVTV
ncbi:hypothetical protein ES705_15015 [subsurface metagenome]